MTILDDSELDFLTLRTVVGRRARNPELTASGACGPNTTEPDPRLCGPSLTPCGPLSDACGPDNCAPNDAACGPDNCAPNDAACGPDNNRLCDPVPDDGVPMPRICGPSLCGPLADDGPPGTCMPNSDACAPSLDPDRLPPWHDRRPRRDSQSSFAATIDSSDPQRCYLRLRADVYLVSGARRAALYDFHGETIHWLTQASHQLLADWLTHGLVPALLRADQRTLLDRLNACELVELADHPAALPHIHELARPPQPEFAWIEITQTCNLECTHCYEESSHRCTRRLSLAEFERVVAELVALGVRRVQLIGGEPLALGSSARAMLEHAAQSFDWVEVYTNGTLIDESWAELFRELGVRVALSIHSYDPTEHDKVTTVAGSHARTMRGVRQLERLQVPYRVAGIEVRDVDMGVRSDEPFAIRADVIRLTGRARIGQVSEAMFERKAITLDRFRRKLDRDFVRIAVSGHNCFQSKLYVDSALHVYPCVMERRLSHGSLQDGSLDAILDQQLAVMSKDAVEGCRECEFRYACFDCRPDSNGERPDAKPWYCTYRPREGRWQAPAETHAAARSAQSPRQHLVVLS